MTTSLPGQKPPINLLRGWPHPSLLPTPLLTTAAAHTLSHPSTSTPALSYGPDAGHAPARAAIASWLTESYSPAPGPISPERICITGGASQNLGNLLASFTDAEDTLAVWVVAPAYFLAFGIFEDGGFAGKMRAVGEDGEGVDVGALERGMEGLEREAGAAKRKARQGRKVYRHVVYCVPTFANPSSRTMTLNRRRELVRAARRFDALVVADDVYDFLQWPAHGVGVEGVGEGEGCLPRLVDVDREIDGGAEREGADGFGNAVSNGSFSKIAGPGVRCGWVEGTSKFAYGVSQTGTTRSGGAPSQLTSVFLTHLLETKQLQNHIRHTLQPTYARRYHILQEAIRHHLIPLGFTLTQPTRSVVGGFFVWLILPEGMSAEDLAEVCSEEGVIVAQGSMFEVPGDASVKFDGNVRLCFTWEDEGRLAEGVVRIKNAARKLVAGEKRSGDYVMVEKKDACGVDGYK